MTKVLRRSDASLVFRIPCDRQYLEAVRDLSFRIAEYIGYSEAQAHGVETSVDMVVSRLLAAASPGDPRASVEVTFSAAATAVEIWIRCRDPLGGGPGAVDLERVIRGETEPGGPLAAVRQSVGDLKVGREDGVTFCCLTHELPADA